MKEKLVYLLLFVFLNVNSQEIYVVNSVNEIKIVNAETFEVTSLFTIDIQQAGFITDLAFAPDGRLFAVTNVWTLIEIDLQNDTFIPLADLPQGDPYTALVCNADNELLTARIFSEELYAYDLDTDETTLVDTGISTPGDFTFYKGNLVYPYILNDFIKAYDGTNIENIGCSVPLLWTFVNDFEACESNTIYAFDQFAKLYRYDLETEDFEILADLVSETGLLYGGATMTEYMASACPVEELSTVLCDPLGNEDLNNFGIILMSNPVRDVINFEFMNVVPETYKMYSVDGKLVQVGKIEDQEISITELNFGVYFLQLFEPNGLNVFTEKIIKK